FGVIFGKKQISPWKIEQTHHQKVCDNSIFFLTAKTKRALHAWQFFNDLAKVYQKFLASQHIYTLGQLRCYALKTAKQLQKYNTNANIKNAPNNNDLAMSDGDKFFVNFLKYPYVKSLHFKDIRFFEKIKDNNTNLLEIQCNDVYFNYVCNQSKKC
ncbi:hypothetical protein RFI_32400, partial [Reticulomyxa filosa]